MIAHGLAEEFQEDDIPPLLHLQQTRFNRSPAAAVCKSTDSINLRLQRSLKLSSRLYRINHASTWRLAASQNRPERDEAPSPVYHVSYAPGGKLVIACCEHGLRGISHNTHRTVFNKLTSVNGCSFFNAHQFVTGSDENEMYVWDLRQMHTPLQQLVGHGDYIKSLEIDDDVLYSSSFDGTIKAWSLKTFTCLNSIFLDSVVRVALHPATKTLAVSLNADRHFDRGGLMLIDDFGLSTFEQWDDHYDAGNEALFLANGYSVTGLEWLDGMVLLEDADASLRLASISSMKYSPDGRWLAARQSTLEPGNLTERTLLYDLTTMRSQQWETTDRIRIADSTVIHEKVSATEYIKELAFSHDGTMLASPRGNGVGIYSTHDPRIHSTVADGCNTAILAACFAPHDRTVAMASYDAHVSFAHYY